MGDTFGLSSPIVIGLISMVVGLGFYILGFASTGWYKAEYLGQEFSEGLWEICTKRPAVPDDGWHEATRALITIGLVCYIICIVIAVGFVSIQRLERHRKILIFGLLIATILTVLFSLIGLIIYGKNRGSPHWSFAMTTIGSILVLVAAICTSLQICVQLRAGS